MLTAGLCIVLALLIVGYIVPLFINSGAANVGSFDPALPPGPHHLLGTDTQGRDVLTELILAIPQSLKIALVAGIIGLGAGAFLGLLSGYVGGLLDSVIRTISDALMTIPSLAVLIVIASTLRTTTVFLVGLIIASLSWMYPLRTVRAQTLSLRERGYLQVAKLNGLRGVELIVRQIIPNLLPYIAASFVSTVSVAVLASIGLEALGLGPQNTYTLGNMIYWSLYYNAILREMWWWWLPPVIVIAVIFIALLLVTIGMDPLVQRRPHSG